MGMVELFVSDYMDDAVLLAALLIPVGLVLFLASSLNPRVRNITRPDRRKTPREGSDRRAIRSY